jgi:hypothetical protein
MIQAPLGSADDLQDGVSDAQFPIINDIPGAFDRSTMTLSSVASAESAASSQLAWQRVENRRLPNPTSGTADYPAKFCINFTGLASNSTGDTWGINVRTLSGQQAGKTVDIAEFAYLTTSDATVISDVGPDIVALTGAKDTSAIQSVNGADFLPATTICFSSKQPLPSVDSMPLVRMGRCHRFPIPSFSASILQLMH